MNRAFQIAKHVASQLRQWPFRDRAVVEREVTKAIDSGNAWLFYEPKQLELFECPK
jgi:hypothetical protein